jgi:hypothetical protein
VGAVIAGASYGWTVSEVTTDLSLRSSLCVGFLDDAASREVHALRTHAFFLEQKECRVVYVKKELTGPTKVAVEFTRPAPTFWRIAYPPDDWAASA